MSLLWTEAGWSEPDEDDWRNAKPNKFGKKPAELYGNVSDVDEYFQGASTRPTPWPQAARHKHLHDYDKDAVGAMLRKPPVLEDVDPRVLHSTQPSIVRAAAQHYLTDEHAKTGKTYEAGHNVGNSHPVVFIDTATGEHRILSGHHRATAALFQGRPLRARVVRGIRPPRSV